MICFSNLIQPLHFCTRLHCLLSPASFFSLSIRSSQSTYKSALFPSYKTKHLSDLPILCLETASLFRSALPLKLLLWKSSPLVLNLWSFLVSHHDLSANFDPGDLSLFLNDHHLLGWRNDTFQIFSHFPRCLLFWFSLKSPTSKFWRAFNVQVLDLIAGLVL